MSSIKNISDANFDLLVDLADAEYKTDYLKAYNTLIHNGIDSSTIAEVLRKYSSKSILHDTKYNDFWTKKYKREYDKVLKSWLVLAEKVGFVDSLDLSFFLNTILYDGYLSFNHKFSFDSDSGVCMNFSYLLSDFLKKSGI